MQSARHRLEQCDQQGTDLNSTIAIHRTDSNVSTYTFKALSLGFVEYYCSVSACTRAGLCTTSLSDGFKVDLASPMLECLQVKGFDEQTVDVSEYRYVSQHSVLPIDWVAPLHHSKNSEAFTLCPDLTTNFSRANSLSLDQAPLEKFEIFISYTDLALQNQTFNFTEDARDVFSTSTAPQWMFLSNMSTFSSDVKHSISIQLSEQSCLSPNRLYTLMITATKVSGAFASSNLFSFMYDDTPPEVGNISDIPIFGLNEPKWNVSSARNGSQIEHVYDDVDWISRPAEELQIVWRNFFDAESGISRYLVCIGTFPGLCDISELVDVGSVQSFYSSPQWLQSTSKSDRLYATLTVCNNALPPLCRNSSSDGVGLDTTPPILLEVNDGYEEGVDWQQQGFVNSIFGNWKAVDDISDIAEYEWSFQVVHNRATDYNSSMFFSAGQSRIMGKVGLGEDKSAQKYFVCARAVNQAGLRSLSLCSDGVEQGKTEILVTSKQQEAFGFGVDRLYEASRSLTANTTVYVAINFPNNSVSKDVKLLAGPVMAAEYCNSNSSGLQNPASNNLLTAPNMKVGNYSFVLRVMNSTEKEGFKFRAPIKLSLYFDLSKLTSDVSLSDRVTRLESAPSLLLRNVSSGRWTNAADTCSAEMLMSAGVEKRWDFDPSTSIFSVYICHLTQFAIAFQMVPVARIKHIPNIAYPLNSAILNGTESTDPDGVITVFQWRILQPVDTEAIIQTALSEISQLSNLTPGTYTIELIVEDNDYSSSSNRVQVIVVGEAKTLKIHRQPSLCSVAGERLVQQPVVSVHDELGTMVEEITHCVYFLCCFGKI